MLLTLSREVAAADCYIMEHSQASAQLSIACSIALFLRGGARLGPIQQQSLFHCKGQFIRIVYSKFSKARVKLWTTESKVD